MRNIRIIKYDRNKGSSIDDLNTLKDIQGCIDIILIFSIHEINHKYKFDNIITACRNHDYIASYLKDDEMHENFSRIENLVDGSYTTMSKQIFDQVSNILMEFNCKNTIGINNHNVMFVKECECGTEGDEFLDEFSIKLKGLYNENKLVDLEDFF